MCLTFKPTKKKTKVGKNINFLLLLLKLTLFEFKNILFYVFSQGKLLGTWNMFVAWSHCNFQFFLFFWTIFWNWITMYLHVNFCNIIFPELIFRMIFARSVLKLYQFVPKINFLNSSMFPVSLLKKKR